MKVNTRLYHMSEVYMWSYMCQLICFRMIRFMKLEFKGGYNDLSTLIPYTCITEFDSQENIGFIYIYKNTTDTTQIICMTFRSTINRLVGFKE